MFHLKKKHLVTLVSLLTTFSVGILIAQSNYSPMTDQDKPKSDFEKRRLGYPSQPEKKIQPKGSDKRSFPKETGDEKGKLEKESYGERDSNGGG